MTELSTLCLEVKFCKEFVVSLVVSSYDRVGFGVGRLDCCLRTLRGYFFN